MSLNALPAHHQQTHTCPLATTDYAQHSDAPSAFELQATPEQEQLKTHAASIKSGNMQPDPAKLLRDLSMDSLVLHGTFLKLQATHGP